MAHEAVLFDLDGTLLDTLDDIARAANESLAQGGFPTHPVGDYRTFVGEGVVELFRRCLPPDLAAGEEVARRVAAFRVAYNRCWDDRTRPYDGISELLDTLVGRRLALAVLSNKPDDFTRSCCAKFLARWPLADVRGQIDGVPRKPAPDGAIAIAARLAIAPERFLYVGDTAVDMQTARRAGMLPVGVTWGFRPAEELRDGGARVIIDRPSELLDILDAHA